MTEQGLEPSFTLHGFSIKPMDAPEPGTQVTVRGFRNAQEGTLAKGGGVEWGVFFPHGYHEPFEVKIAEFSGESWGGLHKVEILADFGYDGLDWEFCLDDIKVDFMKREGEDTKTRGEAERVFEIDDL